MRETLLLEAEAAEADLVEVTELASEVAEVDLLLEKQETE